MKPERKQRRRVLKREEQRLNRRIRREATGWQVRPFRMLLRWLFALGALALATLLGAAYWTPLFEIKDISVVGTQRVPVDRIEAALEPLVGENLVRLDESKITDLLAGEELIETFAVQAIPPSVLQVRIRERQPIVQLSDGKTRVLVDASGLVIDESSPAEDLATLPTLRVANLANPGPAFSTATAALLELPVALYVDIAEVEVSTGQTISFLMRGSGIRVYWGGPEEAALKYEVLLSLLVNQDSDKIEIDVTAPRSPVVRYLDF